MRIQNSEKGFSLMEVIVAVAVIATAIVGFVALISFSISGLSVGKSKAIAAGLAQEGIEIVRNIRDSNWLAGKKTALNWRDGLGVGNWRGQYNNSSLLTFSAAPLKLDSNGFYQYDTGNNTLFYRKITIEHPNDYQIKVTCEITWQEKGRNNTVKAVSFLYNWLQES